MIYTPSLGEWIQERLWREEPRARSSMTDVATARARRRVEALLALRDNPTLDRLRAGVKARLIEGERNERIVRWLSIEVTTARILDEAGR